MRVAALGRTKMLYKSIELMNQEGHSIALIGTCPEAPEYDIASADFEKLAKKLGIPFFCDTKINSLKIVDVLRKCNADIAISINWLTIVGKEPIESFPLGILNAHAGDLPRYRGNACPNWAMIASEKKVSLTIHQMEPDSLDSGAILIKEHYPININTKIGDIYNFMIDNVPKMFLRAVNGLADGSIQPKMQSSNSSDALRCYPRIPTDSLIEWNKRAEDILRLINASSEPFSGAYTFFNMRKMTIWRADIEAFDTPSLYVPGQVTSIDRETGTVCVAAADGIVVLREIQIEDGERTVPGSVIKSLRSRLGMNVEEEVYKLYNRIAAE